MNAYELGWDAAEQGKSPKANPFMKVTGEEISWRFGYRAMLESVDMT
jgi:hypothetical protein